MEKIGRKNCVVCGMIVMSAATLTFGLASYSESLVVFILVSAIARIF